ncbi:hypothetical protein DCS32_01055 [Dokdonia sp. Dokd-P16]|nr:hypothetical protein DCS32_01055 [Dokdonia sp. Dokd-P16]
MWNSIKTFASSKT